MRVRGLHLISSVWSGVMVVRNPLARLLGERHDDSSLQWIESGHRRVLLDADITETVDAGTIYTRHIIADAEDVIDVREVR